MEYVLIDKSVFLTMSLDELKKSAIRVGTELKKKDKTLSQRFEAQDDFGRRVCLPRRTVLTNYKNEQIWVKITKMDEKNFHGIIVDLNNKPILFEGKPKEICRQFSQVIEVM